jgi:hypothetical protein
MELKQSRKVLLFTGDAQVGNWVSWFDPEFQPAGRDAKDILGRTVLYKVGHHGSHNATLSKQGLELMGDDLVAMIPVDPHFYKTKASWHNPIPYPELMKALKRKTRGRVAQASPKRKDIFPAKPSYVSHAEWKEFTASVEVNDEERYIEYTVRDD